MNKTRFVMAGDEFEVQIVQPLVDGVGDFNVNINGSLALWLSAKTKAIYLTEHGKAMGLHFRED